MFSTNAKVFAESEKLPDASKQVKITIQTNDQHIKVVQNNTITAEKGVTKWGEIQDEAKGKLQFDKDWELQRGS